MASAPRWKTALSNALSENKKSVVLQLASIEPGTSIPHVRSHIFRSFLAPSEDDRLPLILTSTDVRSPKVKQIVANPHVELAWWIEGKQEQFRIAGLGAIVPAPTHPLFKDFEQTVRTVEPSSGLKKLVGDAGTDFDWEAKRKEVFATMSAHMKASWCRPVPGSPLIGGEEEAKKWPVRVDEPGKEKGEDGEEVSEEDKAKNKNNWETALSNFALVIVDPTEVDYVELGVIPNQRTNFWRNEQGLWEEKPVVP